MEPCDGIGGLFLSRPDLNDTCIMQAPVNFLVLRTTRLIRLRRNTYGRPDILDSDKRGLSMGLNYRNAQGIWRYVWQHFMADFEVLYLRHRQKLDPLLALESRMGCSRKKPAST